MLIRLGYDIRFEIGQPVPMVVIRGAERLELVVMPWSDRAPGRTA